MFLRVNAEVNKKSQMISTKRPLNSSIISLCETRSRSRLKQLRLPNFCAFQFCLPVREPVIVLYQIYFSLRQYGLFLSSWHYSQTVRIRWCAYVLQRHSLSIALFIGERV